MSSRKLIVILMGLLVVLTLIVGANPSLSETDAQSSPYEVFVQKIQSENLGEYGIDIVAMLDKHLAHIISPYLTTADFTNIDYTLEKCNLSENDEDHPSLDDRIIEINVTKQGPNNAQSAYMQVIFAFVLNENGQFDTVLDDEVIGIASSIVYKVMDVTGDDIDDVILYKNGTRGMSSSINIFTWCPKQNYMLMIFNEKLYGYISLSYRFYNNYEFIPAQSAGYDILLYSEISDGYNNILETGSTRFIFNGNEYVVNGTYYDYQARGEAIYEDMQNSKSK